MTEPTFYSATYIGQVSGVRGSLVTIHLRRTRSTLLMVEGSTYRVGQIGSFVRIPLGYTDLFGICTQVGADPTGEEESDDPSLIVADPDPRLSGYRWIQVALFGESTEGRFERGIGQFPTVGDEVHVVTARDLDVIYTDRGDPNDAVMIGRIAGTDGVAAALRLSALVTRHVSVVGSTGAGKSNLVAILLRALGNGPYHSARALVIDPHGEYGSAIPEQTRVLSTNATDKATRLRIPYWALTFDELAAITMGQLRDTDAEFLRNRVRDLKLDASDRLPTKTPHQAITADSPIPFSLRRLWWELENNERMTFTSPHDQTDDTREKVIEDGDIARLIPPRYPPPPPERRQRLRDARRRVGYPASWSLCVIECLTVVSLLCLTTAMSGRRTSMGW